MSLISIILPVGYIFFHKRQTLQKDFLQLYRMIPVKVSEKYS